MVMYKHQLQAQRFHNQETSCSCCSCAAKNSTNNIILGRTYQHIFTIKASIVWSQICVQTWLIQPAFLPSLIIPHQDSSADRNYFLQRMLSIKISLIWVLFSLHHAGLLLSWSTLSSCKYIRSVVSESLWAFRPTAEFQPPRLGFQRQRHPIVATAQRSAPRGLAGGPVVRGGVPERGAVLRASLVPLHQHQRGLQRVRSDLP